MRRWMVVPGARLSTMYARARGLVTASAGTSSRRTPMLPGPAMGALAEYGLADRAVPVCWTAAVRADPAALATGERGPMTAPVTVAAATITGTHTQRPR